MEWYRSVTVAIFAVVAFCTTTACHVACIDRGFDGGYYIKKNSSCVCLTYLDYEALLAKQIFSGFPKSDKEQPYQVDERKNTRYDAD